MSKRIRTGRRHAPALVLVSGALAAAAWWFVETPGPNVARAAEEQAAAHEEEAAVPEGVAPFTDEQIEKYGVEVGQAGPGTLRTYLTLPGEIRMNADRVAHVVLPVTGYAREVNKNLGDAVRKGETMASFASRELAEARAAYAAARARAGIAQSSLKREKSLYEQKISPQQDLLDAEKESAETEIAVRSAEQQLRALGYQDADFTAAARKSGDSYTRFLLQAPMDGTVIEKHVTLGELIKSDTAAYVIADLSNVWADFTVTQQDLARVRAGQTIAMTSEGHKEPVEAALTYLGPIVSSDTRTSLARAVVDNAGGAWIPGQFVTGKILVESTDVPVLVQQSALQTVDGTPSAFVKVDQGFEVRPLKLGRSAGEGVEVLAGLEAGETYATANTFVIKAQLGKSEAGHEEE